jgi:hypothetical protein
MKLREIKESLSGLDFARLVSDKLKIDDNFWVEKKGVKLNARKTNAGLVLTLWLVDVSQGFSKINGKSFRLNRPNKRQINNKVNKLYTLGLHELALAEERRALHERVLTFFGVENFIELTEEKEKTLNGDYATMGYDDIYEWHAWLNDLGKNVK